MEAAKQRSDHRKDQPNAKAKAKGKAKAKAKAKAKTEEPIREDDSAEKAKGNGKGKAKAKAKAVAAKEHENEKKGIGQPKAKAKAKAMACLPSTRRNRPPVMQLGDCTVYHEKGKIHRNSDCYRVFKRTSDRCDRKVKIGDDIEAAWEKALGIIEAEPELPQDVD